MKTKPQNPKSHEDHPVLTLIKQIKENTLDPVVLSADDRRRCVDVLWSEGVSVAETAQILKCAERTIFRDRSELRSSHSLHLHAEFAPQMAGELIRQAETSISRLRRIARETGASAMERCVAENFAFKVQLEMITKLQSMGYLPRVPTGVVAQVVNQAQAAIETYEQLAQRLGELAVVDQEIGQPDAQTLKRRAELEELVRRGRAGAELNQMVQAG